MSNNQRIAIAHRVCPAKSENAVGFGDKFDMVRRNALSMMAALRGFDVQLFVLLDGCPRSYDIFFRRLATESPNVDVVIDYADHIGNKASFKWQVETLLHRTNAPLVYFSEDDYLYAPSAFSLMASLLEQPWASFATPLDHPDRYNGSFAEPSANAIRLCAGCHWRETGTTCLTFMARRECLEVSWRRLQQFSEGMEDSVVWLGITKHGVFSPGVIAHSLASAFLRVFLRRKVWYGRFIPLIAWAQNWKSIVFAKRLSLWSPVPSLAIHCCSTSIPPASGWISSVLPDGDFAAIVEAREKYLVEGR